MFRRNITSAISDQPQFPAGNQISNRLAIQIAVRKQGLIGFRRCDVSAKHHLPCGGQPFADVMVGESPSAKHHPPLRQHHPPRLSELTR
jgi:hypothetical protein